MLDTDYFVVNTYCNYLNIIHNALLIFGFQENTYTGHA